VKFLPVQRSFARTTSAIVQHQQPTDRKRPMNARLPRTITQPMQFKNGCATGMSHRWKKGQYCSIMTEAGIVGCGIYDLATAGEFGQAIAIAKGTPQHPLVDPDDLLEASIVAATPQALALGIQPGMSGRAAVELMLAANTDTA